MAQPIKTEVKGSAPAKRKRKLETTKAHRIKMIKEKRKRGHEYGTSKLEERFARDFLDKLGLDYVYQYKAESIGRYFDFKLKDYPVFFEVDGDYYHSRGLVYEEMSPMQKKNKKVDEIKDKYCSRNGYLLIRVWEYDINNNPTTVRNYLKEVLRPILEQKEKEDNKK